MRAGTHDGQPEAKKRQKKEPTGDTRAALHFRVAPVPPRKRDREARQQFGAKLGASAGPEEKKQIGDHQNPPPDHTTTAHYLHSMACTCKKRTVESSYRERSSVHHTCDVNQTGEVQPRWVGSPTWVALQHGLHPMLLDNAPSRSLAGGAEPELP
jgi:hypothetical protein